MRVFEHGNWDHGDLCPLCRTAQDLPVVLVPIPGTEDGNNIEAQQVHKRCLDMVFRMYANEGWT